MRCAPVFSQLPWRHDGFAAALRQPPAGYDLRGFLFPDMSRATHWLIDGFNLHHSILQSTVAGAPPPLWVDPMALAGLHQHLLGRASHVDRVEYFSAIPHHLRETDPAMLERHRLHLRAMTARRPACGLHLGHFQPRRGLEGRVWQEKGTDMAMAAVAMRACLDNPEAGLVIVSGDSDFVPLARLVRERWPGVDLRFAFPAHRASRRLREMCPNSFSLSPASYVAAQLPMRVRLPSGKHIECPVEWRTP